MDIHSRWLAWGAGILWCAKLAGWAMPDFWLPLTAEILLDGATERLKSPDQHFLDLVGRVQAGDESEDAGGAAGGELHDWQASHLADMRPQEKEIWRKQTLHLTPGGAGINDMREQYADGLKLLLAAAGCVLLVACANIANLLLARGLKNRQQTAVRIALGSARSRLVRKALMESVTLGVVGGLLGIGVAFAGTKLILHLAFRCCERGKVCAGGATPSWPVLLFTLGVSVLTGVIFGIAPAWMTSHAEPVEALTRSRSSTGEQGPVAAESLGHCPGSHVAGAADRRGDAGAKPAQPGAPEFRIRDPGPLSRVYQSSVGWL